MVGPVKRRKVRKIVHFNQSKLFYGDIETEQGKEPVQGEKDTAEGLERELEQTNENKSAVIEDSDSDSDSVSEDIINNDEDDSNANFSSETDLSAQRPPSPIQQRVEDRNRAQRPGSVRRLQRLDDNSENDGRDQSSPRKTKFWKLIGEPKSLLIKCNKEEPEPTGLVWTGQYRDGGIFLKGTGVLRCLLRGRTALWRSMKKDLIRMCNMMNQEFKDRKSYRPGPDVMFVYLRIFVTLL